MSPLQITVAAAQILGVQLGPERAERTFEVLYLDERVRIVQFLPHDPEKSSEPVLFVLRRLGSTTQVSQLLCNSRAAASCSCYDTCSIYMYRHSIA